MGKPIFIIGATGYMGMAICREAKARGLDWMPISGQSIDFKIFRGLVDRWKPGLVINAAAYIPSPNVAACDLPEHQAPTLAANLMLPAMLAEVCSLFDVAFCQLSTGCLFDEAGPYKETAEPLRGFGRHAGFYIGTKLEAERAVQINPKTYILRLRLPFGNEVHPRNYITKMLRLPVVWDHLNSMVHRNDFAKALFDLWTIKPDYGIYHVCNKGVLPARQIMRMITQKGMRANAYHFEPGPVAGCWLDTQKLEDTGVKLRYLEDAFDDALCTYH